MGMAATQQTGGPGEREGQQSSFIEGSIDLELAPHCWLPSGGEAQGRGWL